VALREVLLGAVAGYLAGCLAGSITLGSARENAVQITPWDVCLNLLRVYPRKEPLLVPAAERALNPPDVEDRLARAEKQWRSSFRRRAATMKVAMKLTEHEDAPTPKTDDDT
jgi:hypothetical protein